MSNETLVIWANEQVQKMIEDVRWYVSEGLSREQALENVLSASCLGKMYKQQVIDNA